MKFRTILALLFLPLFMSAQVQQANLLGHWEDTENLPMVGWLSSWYNEVWGFAINDAEIGVIGSTMGTHFIDVTDPTNPTEIVLIEGMAAGSNLVHRDYHTNGNYLYAVADEGGTSGLEIFDLSDAPNSIERVYASNEFIVTSHNIFIDEEHDRLYAVAGQNNVGQNFRVLILDISDPVDPQLLAQYPNASFSIPSNHDIYIKDHIAYINSANTGLYVVDFADAENPELLGTLTQYPDKGYNHAGWLDEEGRYYYMLDETHGTDIKALDVCEPDDIQVVKTFNADAAAASSIPHNCIVHCNRLYVSYYYEGLQIYDISDPADPVRIYEYDTYPGADESFFAGAWGVYPLLPSGNILVSDLQTGLYVFEAIEDDCSYNVLADCDASNDAGTSSIENEKLSNLEVFPQPANAELNVVFSAEEASQADFILQNLNGQRVQTFLQQNISADENNFTFDISSLAAGMYFLTIQNEDGIKTVKVVVE